MRSQRQPFENLSRRVIAETLDRYLAGDGPIVEIGMGDGQLRQRLPAATLPRMLHTEPQAAASRAFRKQNPQVVVTQAPAERLPFEAGGAAAVLALCVMDVVPDGPAVVRELARVLQPGGRFIHWLDMSTVLTPVVASLAGTDLALLPNVFTDPSAAEWPEDLFILPREQLALVVAILHRSGHPLARPLAQYLKVFSSSPLAVGPAAAELAQVQDNAQLRLALADAFRAAGDVALPEERARLAGFRGRPVSSARHFEQRLRGWFEGDGSFRVEQSDLHRVWEASPRGESSFAYTSCCVGEQRYLPFAPDVLLCSDAQPASEGDKLAELGVFAFVATRI